jgi:hypothetical protein
MSVRRQPAAGRLFAARRTQHPAAERNGDVDPSGVDRRLDELELLLRQLTAQARDVVQELGEIKAEIKHINGLDDTLEPSRALGPDSSMTDVVRALHSNFRVRESSLEGARGSIGHATAINASAQDRLKAMERVMASAMLRSVADSREPRTGTVDTPASTASEQPGKWPQFGQDTISRFERGIPSRGGTGKLPLIVDADSASGEPNLAAAQARDRSPCAQAQASTTRRMVRVAAPSRNAPIGTQAACATISATNGSEANATRRTKDSRYSSRRNRHLVGLTGSPLGWGPRIQQDH